MPITLHDIEVDIDFGPDALDIDADEPDPRCSLCRQKLELQRSLDFKPLPHRAAHCLHAIMATLDFLAKETGVYEKYSDLLEEINE